MNYGRKLAALEEREPDYNDVGRGVAMRGQGGLPLARKQMTPAPGLLQPNASPAPTPRLDFNPDGVETDVPRGTIPAPKSQVPPGYKETYDGDWEENHPEIQKYYSIHPEMQGQEGTDAFEEHFINWRQQDIFQQENPEMEGQEDTDEYNEAYDNWLEQKGWKITNEFNGPDQGGE